LHSFLRRLVDKCAIVTGGSSGIGKGIALRLAREGANVVVNYSKSEDQAKAVVEEIKRLGVTQLLYGQMFQRRMMSTASFQRPWKDLVN
jgi:NAD(P)-dependent dehydrogenase (short-subunit alcohol dehydrogenase family)